MNKFVYLLLVIFPFPVIATPMMFTYEETIFSSGGTNALENLFPNNQRDITPSTRFDPNLPINVDLLAYPGFVFPSPVLFPPLLSDAGSGEWLSSAMGPDGLNYLPQSYNNTDIIRRTDLSTGVFTDFVLPLDLGGGLTNISYAFGNFYIVTSSYQPTILEIDSNNGVFFDGDDIFRKLNVSIPFSTPVIWDITFDSNGSFYLLDMNNRETIGGNPAIYRYSSSIDPNPNPNPNPVHILAHSDHPYWFNPITSTGT